MSGPPKSRLNAASACRCSSRVRLAGWARPLRTGRPQMTFAEWWGELLPIGREELTGGYRRYSWTGSDAACRAWFARTATQLGLRTDCDRNGNLWAWWGRPGGPQAVVTGSHLDSVPDGGAYDGPLGVVSAFAAIADLRSDGFRPARPIGVAAFTEEEGARFGVACLGSRLLTGALTPDAASALRDQDGVTLAEAMVAAGRAAPRVGAGPAPVSSRTSRRARHLRISVPPSASPTESGRTAAGGSPSPGEPITLARPGSPTAGIRCFHSPRPCLPLEKPPSAAARWRPSERLQPSPARRTPSAHRSMPGSMRAHRARRRFAS